MTVSKKTPSEDEVMANLTADEFDDITFQRQVDKEHLPIALSMLPAKLRTVFQARAVDGVSYERLAARMHDTEANVRKMYSRAQASLKEHLRDLSS